MLLVSDRSREGAQLQRALSTAGPCTLVALHQPVVDVTTGELLICDVALDNITSVELLRAAIAHYRSAAATPILMLARDAGQLTLAQAAALGATQVLPPRSAVTDVVVAVASLLTRSGATNRPETGEVRLFTEGRHAEAVLQELFTTAQRQQAISPAVVDRGGRIVLSAIAQANIQSWLDVVWTFDDVTYQHCLLVAGLVVALARELGMTEASQHLLSQAALVHDIGKAEIPHAILSKEGQFSPVETKVMRCHPGRGYRMLSAGGDFDPRILDVVLHHHEYLDGSGYPDGLSGASLSRMLRMVTICDIYAALVERRSYKAPASPVRAWSVLSKMEGKVDAGLLRVFAGVLRLN